MPNVSLIDEEATAVGKILKTTFSYLSVSQNSLEYEDYLESHADIYYSHSGTDFSSTRL